MRKCGIILFTVVDNQLKYGFYNPKKERILICSSHFDNNDSSLETIIKQIRINLNVDEIINIAIKKCIYTIYDHIYFMYIEKEETFQNCIWLTENELSNVSGYGINYLPAIVESIKKYSTYAKLI